MDIPDRLLASLEGLKGFDKNTFIEAHDHSLITSVRINPQKKANELFPGIVISPVPWSEYGYYLDKRPSFTFDPLLHAGCYYVQEASSMFLEQAIRQLTDPHTPLRVLDLSAAPGGKSTHLQSLLNKESLLVSNDVIRNRALILKQNMIRWGSTNVVVTSNDPQHFQRLPEFFDLVVADAPCSGSGLFRKDAEAVNEWSPDNVALCHGRQKRILSDILPTLKQDGLLIYSTCSFSREENEDIADWLMEEHEMQSFGLTISDEWGITETLSDKGAKGYRFYPDKVKGEGFFLACFRKTRGEEKKKNRTGLPEKLSAKGVEIVSKWVEPGTYQFVPHENSVLILPVSVHESFLQLQSHLFIQYAGVLAGELIRDKMVPDHSLAMSPFVSKGIPRIDVTEEEAIRYLQKADITLEAMGKGWQLITFNNNPLGWVNVLSNRINNYYPKDLRILKQRNDMSRD